MRDLLFALDFQALFIPQESLTELFLRGTSVYLFLFTLLTVIHKRHSGMLGTPDFLFVVLIAASSHYALTGGHISITASFVVVLTIIFWNFVFNVLSYKFTFVNTFFNPRPLLLVKDGKLLRHNMRREFILEEEILTALRKHGRTTIDEVQQAHLEADGEISFVLKRPQRKTVRKKKIV